MSEMWRPVAEWEGLYEVSSAGRVRSVDREVNGRSYKGMVRRLKMSKHHGYAEVTLVNQGVFRTYLVHRLVTHAFYGPCPGGHEVAHANGVRTDNSVSNLRYVTHTENMRDRDLHGTTLRGERNVRAKLTEDQVREIRRSSVSPAELAETMGVTPGAVYFVRNRTNWRHVV